MNIPIFLAAGMAAELVLALIRPLRGATRGLVCWSVSAVVLSMCCAVYFISSGDITFDLPSAIRGIGGAGVLVLIAALIELFSPSRRSRQKPEQDPQRSERSLNIVLSVAAGILCAAPWLCRFSGSATLRRCFLCLRLRLHSGRLCGL